MNPSGIGDDAVRAHIIGCLRVPAETSSPAVGLAAIYGPTRGLSATAVYRFNRSETRGAAYSMMRFAHRRSGWGSKVRLREGNPCALAEVPTRSTAWAVSVCAAFVVVVSQRIEYGGGVTAAPSLTPSTLNCTRAMPTLSDAVADTVIVPATVAPAAGAVIATDSGGVSATAAARYVTRSAGRSVTSACLVLAKDR